MDDKYLPKSAKHLVVEQGCLDHILGKPFKIFPKFVRVFDLYFAATVSSPDANLLHGASILYQYIDNDGNGRPDNMVVYEKMVKSRATMIMFRDRAEANEHKGFMKKARSVNVFAQPLYAAETFIRGEFDAALEECFHLLTYGYSLAYPDIFGHKRGSQMADCCDRARGGFFKDIPVKYPPGAWFTYYDKTCHYHCQVQEYTYWAMTSILGAQTNRTSVLKEWRLITPQLVEERDPAVYALLTNKKFKLPAKLPKTHSSLYEDELTEKLDACHCCVIS